MTTLSVDTSFTNINGQTFDKVREIPFTKEQLIHIGKYITSSKHEPTDFFDEDYDLNSGVHIYQSLIDPKKAYRIYKEFAEPNFNGYSDDVLIQNLQERQPNISKTTFPFGVVTLDGRIIGQEIPYFDNSINVLEYINKCLINDPIKLYKELLEIICELYKNGITYVDVHPRNFMIGLEDKKINLIDFELSNIKFDSSSSLKDSLNNYRQTINYINQKLNLLNRLGSFIQVSSYDEAFEQLDDMQRKLRY